MAEAEDLLGSGFVMQLVGKLALSLVAALLISWAYKLYSSWGQAQGQRVLGQSNGTVQHPSQRSQTAEGTCIKCKTELQPRRVQVESGECVESSLKDSEWESLEHQENPAENYEKEILEYHDYSPENSKKETEERHKCSPENSEKEISLQTAPKDCNDKVLPSAQYLNYEDSKETTAQCDFRSTLLPHISTEQGLTSPTWEWHSPCFLRKLESTVGVGRELRQDLGHPSTFSSFQSTAEITVENGDLLLERPGRKHIEVRGKIYDYYVESSSQSVSSGQSYSGLTRTTERWHEDYTSQDSQRGGFAGKLMRGEDSCSTEPTPVSRPHIISPRHLGLPWNDSLFSVGKHEFTLNGRYLQINESANPHAPFLRPTALTPGSSKPCSRRPSIGDLCSSTVGPKNVSMIITRSDTWDEFPQMPPGSMESQELESLVHQLDLSNCLQALSLARQHRHAMLEESALRVLSDNYLQVLQDPVLYESLKAHDKFHIHNRRMKGQPYLMVADMDPQDWVRDKSTMPELCKSKISSGLYYYDDYEDTWHQKCTLPKEVVSRSCTMCTVDNYLFVTVSCQGASRVAKPSRKVFCYNPLMDIWKEICPMNEPRILCKLVALQGHIYAIGGEGVCTVERYDPCTDRWTFVAPLPNGTFAVAHRAAACNGEIFVLGGATRYSLLRYNPKTDAWRQSLIMNTKGKTADMVAVRNFLYRFDVSPFHGISVYRYHTVARIWYECCSKHLSYCPDFQCAAVDDIIYCISPQFTLKFLADEISPTFSVKDLKVHTMAKGVLFPFVLVLPDKGTLPTKV